AAAFALQALARRRLRTPAALVAATTVVFAVAATGAVSAGWRLQGRGSAGSARGQLDALAATAGGRIVAVDLTAHRLMTTDELVAGTRVEVPVAQNRSPGARLSRPLLMLSEVPAGEYRLVVRHQSG